MVQLKLLIQKYYNECQNFRLMTPVAELISTSYNLGIKSYGQNERGFLWFMDMRVCLPKAKHKMAIV